MLLFLKDSLKKKTLKHVCGSGSALIHVVEDLLVLEPDSGDNKNWQQLEHVLRYLTTNVVQKKKSNGHLQSHILCTRVCLSSRKCTLVRRKGCVLPKNTAITWPRRANTSASSAPTSVAARPSRAMSSPSISPSSTSSGLYSLEKEGVYSTQNKHR